MKKNKIFKLFMIGFTAMAFTSCTGDDDDNPTPPVSDEEVLTDLRLTFTDVEGAIPAQTFVFSDPDGPGGNSPVQDVISVLAPAVYAVTIEVLDASNPNDVEDITEEIEEEDEEHQFFFVTSGSASDVLTITYADDDQDDNGNPVGLRTIWSVSESSEGEGSVIVTLLHEPNKTAEGIAIDNPSVAGGETDIEVQFDFVAQ